MLSLVFSVLVSAHGGCHADHDRTVCCVIDQHGDETCVVVEDEDDDAGDEGG